MFNKHGSQIIQVEVSKHIDPVKKEKSGASYQQRRDFELPFFHSSRSY